MIQASPAQALHSGWHAPTWQKEEWASIITGPMPVLSLQLCVKCDSIQSPLMGRLSFG
jgi:hypothetical protein